MEPKCSLCSFLGETPHCGNCAVIKKANTNKQFRMTNLKLTPSKLVKLVENTPVDELKECLSVGDYIEFTSEIGEKADFSPFYSDGIIALDACTALSGIVNCIVLED